MMHTLCVLAASQRIPCLLACWHCLLPLAIGELTRAAIACQTLNGFVIIGVIVWNMFDRTPLVKHLVFFYIIHGAELSIAITLVRRLRRPLHLTLTTTSNVD